MRQTYAIRWLGSIMAILLTAYIVIIFLCNAPYRWSRRLNEAIKSENTQKALILIDEGISKGHSLDTLSARPSIIWTFLESTPKTPLQTACDKGNYFIAEQLLLKGASPRSTEGGASREPIVSVLLNAYSPDDVELIKLLIDHGASFYDAQFENNILILAAQRFPQKYNAEADPTTGSYYDSEYSEDIAKGIAEVFMLLSEYCDCYVVDGANRNALHIAALYGNWYLAEELVNHFHFSLDAKDEWGNTAYDLALEKKAPNEILQILRFE